jgi:hypothetical protein
VFPGTVMQPASTGVAGHAGDAGEDDNRGNVADETIATAEASTPEWSTADTSGETEVVDGDVVQEMNTTPPVVDGESAPASAETAPPQRGRSRGGRGRAKPRTDRKGHAEAKPAAEGKAAPEPRPSGEGRAARTKPAIDGKPGAEAKARKSPAARPRAPRARTRKEAPATD